MGDLTVVLIGQLTRLEEGTYVTTAILMQPSEWPFVILDIHLDFIIFIVGNPV
jgi:hypothetical protein